MQDRYELIRRLGEGGCGQVYLARFVGQAGFQKKVALKFLNASTSSDPHLIANLRDEARLLGLLRHGNIVHVDRLIRLRGTWVIVMEYVPGVDLTDLLHKGTLPASVVMEVVSKISAGLSAAFEHVGPDGRPLHMTHCDIKPDNIRVTPFGEVKLLDFGIAQAEFAGREGSGRELYGTPRYMSPEGFRGTIRPAVDTYALGLVAFEAVTGQRLPVVHLDRSTHADRIERARYILERHRVHSSVSKLILEMISFRPEDRPSHSSLRHQAHRLAATCGESLAEWLEQRSALPREASLQREATHHTPALPSDAILIANTRHLSSPAAHETTISLAPLNAPTQQLPVQRLPTHLNTAATTRSQDATVNHGMARPHRPASGTLRLHRSWWPAAMTGLVAMLGLVVSAFFGLQLALHLNLLDKMTEHASSAEHATRSSLG